MDNETTPIPMFEPVNDNKRNFEIIVENIRRAVYTGALEPGQQLPSELELARQFNVGRSAVREALKVLELSGLLIVRRGYNGGTFVAPPDFEEASEVATLLLQLGHTMVDQLTEAREVIEVRAAELAAERCDEASLKEIRATIGRLEQHANVPARFITADVDFHIAVAQLSANNVFVLILGAIRKLLMQDLNRLINDEDARREIIAQHHTIFDAIAKHEGASAGHAMRTPLQFVSSQLPDSMGSNS